MLFQSLKNSRHHSPVGSLSFRPESDKCQSFPKVPNFEYPAAQKKKTKKKCTGDRAERENKNHLIL